MKPTATNSEQPQPCKPHIPNYELLRCIGQGSYGDVWLARSVTGVFRALKLVYRARFEDSRPFQREVEGIRRFDPISRQDDGLVDLFHVGENEAQGYFYYVMELADDCSREPGEESTSPQPFSPSGEGRRGEPGAQSTSSEGHSPGGVGKRGQLEFSPEAYSPKTLDRVLAERKRLPFAEALELGISLSKALSCLHKHGLVHRDVKTSNIIYVSGAPKLADMGMVTRMADLQSFVGTEGFIPPEGPGTPQADVFSLGKVLYEATMGEDRKAFPNLPDDIDTWPDAEQLLELNEVLLKACHNDFQKRHQSASELYADLVCLLNGKSIRRLRKLERRLSQLKRAAAWVFLAGAFLLFLGYEFIRERNRSAEDHARAVGSHLARGLQYLHSGDLIQSLPSFIQASVLDEPSKQRLNSVRIGSVLAQAPKLLHFWWNTNETTDGQFSNDGRLVVVATRQGQVRHSKASARVFTSPA